MVDYLMKWPEVVALPDTKAETVAKAFVEQVVCPLAGRTAWKVSVPCSILKFLVSDFLADVQIVRAVVLASVQ
jgi:hypothetical protein